MPLSIRVQPLKLLGLCAVQVLSPLLWGQANSGPAAEPPTQTGDVRRFELGGQVIDMRTGGCFQAPRCNTPQFGLGPGATLNLNPHFALDTNLNILPSSIVSDGYFADGSVNGGRASEFLTGVRAEARARRYGFFLDAQPGFVSWSQVLTGVVFIRAPDGTVIASHDTHGRRTFFASKMGAGFEYSAGTRMRVRVDFADLVLRYGHSAMFTCDTCVTWRNNPQITLGLYAALGKHIAWQPPEYNPRNVHPFWGSLTSA